MSGAQFQALLAAAAAAPVTAAYLGAATVGAATSHSVAMTFGTQPKAFYVVAVFGFGGNTNVSSCSIAGIGATIIAQPFSSFCGATMAIALIPAGTASGNVVFNTGSNSEGIIAAYRMDGLTRSTPTAFATTASHTYSVASNSAIVGIAGAFAASGTPSVSWSGITADYQNYTVGAGGSAAHNNLTSPNPSDTISASISNAGNGSAVVTAVFSP